MVLVIVYSFNIQGNVPKTSFPASWLRHSFDKSAWWPACLASGICLCNRRLHSDLLDMVLSAEPCAANQRFVGCAGWDNVLHGTTSHMIAQLSALCSSPVQQTADVHVRFEVLAHVIQVGFQEIQTCIMRNRRLTTSATCLHENKTLSWCTGA